MSVMYLWGHNRQAMHLISSNDIIDVIVVNRTIRKLLMQCLNNVQSETATTVIELSYTIEGTSVSCI